MEGKAENTKVLAVAEATILADYFIITEVNNTRQAAAISDSVNRELKKRGVKAVGFEGKNDGWWVLLDYGPVIVHVMQPEARAYYDLDSYWGDAPEADLEPIRPNQAAAS